MNKLDLDYQCLLQRLIDNGHNKTDRTGTGTRSLSHAVIEHNMADGFPLLTTKKMPFKSVVTELLWFLRGDTNIKYLNDNDCHIWDGDAYKNYVTFFDSSTYSKPAPLSQEQFVDRIKTDPEFAKEWGELGPIYGHQWVNYGGSYKINGRMLSSPLPGINQIQKLIDELKTNPDSRRLMVNAWNVSEIDDMVLPPCHYGFKVYTRELSLQERAQAFNKKYPGKSVNDFAPGGMEVQSINIQLETRYNNANVPTRAISLIWNQRSVDTFLGLPFNIASYGLLLTMLADEVNMVPETLVGYLTDVHLYNNHIYQAKEQIGEKITDEERYNIWFDNNYETGLERFFNPYNLPDFTNSYYTPTPMYTRQPYPLPTVTVQDGMHSTSLNDFMLHDYQSHPAIKAPLSN